MDTTLMAARCWCALTSSNQANECTHFNTSRSVSMVGNAASPFAIGRKFHTVDLAFKNVNFACHVYSRCRLNKQSHKGEVHPLWESNHRASSGCLQLCCLGTLVSMGEGCREGRDPVGSGDKLCAGRCCVSTTLKD
mmetsp:Transcript_20882/g.47853  ORF Transcript_20882/g.47853 Transcript_20882/m.47853 type:complete len:136 (+) Transcript_20882:62-469(+)